MLTSLTSLQLNKNSKGSKSSLEFVVLASMNNSLLPRYLFKAEKNIKPSLVDKTQTYNEAQNSKLLLSS